MNFIYQRIPEIPPRDLANAWIALVAISIGSFFLATRITDLMINALYLWIFSCFILYIQSRKEKISPFIPAQRNVTILLGISLIFLSIINIPLGFGNPPFSIGDFSILLSGIGLIIIGLYNIRSYMVSMVLPAIIVLGFQVYELVLRNEQALAAPLVPPTVFLSTTLIRILGIPAASQSNMITMTAKSGETIRLLVNPECTGIWSLVTFSAILLMVLFTFPEAISLKGALLVGIGYVGTYIGNILRIGAISMSGYISGPSGAIEDTHLYFGWMIFLIWMAIFWYYFFTRFLRISLRSQNQIKN